MKTSKAALLMKGGDYLKQLKVERDILSEEIARNKNFIEELKQQLEDIVAFLPTGKWHESLSLLMSLNVAHFPRW
jgi:hypothetical protein